MKTLEQSTKLSRYLDQALWSRLPIQRLNTSVTQTKEAKELIKPWNHVMTFKGLTLIYIWDTREIVNVLNVDEFRTAKVQLTKAVDNKRPLVITDKKILDLLETTVSSLPEI